MHIPYQKIFIGIIALLSIILLVFSIKNHVTISIVFSSFVILFSILYILTTIKLDIIKAIVFHLNFKWLKILLQKINLFKPYIKYVFLVSLFLITLGSLKFDFIQSTPLLKQIVPWLASHGTIFTIFAIILGIFTFWINRKDIEKESEEESTKEKLAEQQRTIEFPEKYPLINKTPILKNLIRWMYREGWSFSVPLIIITIIFIAIKITIPIVYTGSYIDEYNHIFSGIEIFENQELLQIQDGEYYDRGLYVSFFVGLFMFLFGQTILVAKLVPVTIGIINYFLLYNISKKIILNKKGILILMLIYTFIPWFILNHFYIRMFVFYEFFLLLFILLFLLMIKKIKKIKKLILYFTIFISLILSTYFLSYDSGIYLITLFSILMLLHIYLFEIQNIQIKYNLFDKIKNNQIIKLIIFLTTFTIGFYFLNGINYINRFFLGTITYTSNIEYKYDNLFFNLNFLFTIFFLLSLFLIFNKNVKKEVKAIYIISLFIFIIHLFSSLDLQITRAIIYFLPIFYLFSIYSFFILYKISKNILFKVVLIFLLIFGTYNNYPKNFIQNPYIPTEVNYVEYKNIASFLKNECGSSTIFIFVHNPYIFTFYDINVDYTGYVRNSLLIEDTRYYFNNETNKYYTMYKNIETITNDQEILRIIDYYENTCIVINEESKHYWRYFEQTYIKILEKNKNKNTFGINQINVFD